MSGKVEIFEDVQGKWRYRVVAANGERLTQSEPYASKANAVRGASDLARTMQELVADTNVRVFTILPDKQSDV